MGEQGATLTCLLVLSQAQAPCVCRANVEGPSCDRCKPGFWGLSPSNPEGCTRECALEGEYWGIGVPWGTVPVSVSWRECWGTGVPGEARVPEYAVEAVVGYGVPRGIVPMSVP